MKKKNNPFNFNPGFDENDIQENVKGFLLHRLIQPYSKPCPQSHRYDKCCAIAGSVIPGLMASTRPANRYSIPADVVME